MRSSPFSTASFRSCSSQLATAVFVLASMSTVIGCNWTLLGDGPVDDHPSSGHHGQQPSSPPFNSSEPGCAPAAESASCNVTIDRSKELMIIHRSVLLDQRAQNGGTEEADAGA